MSKFFSKTVKKTTLWSVIIAVILAAAVVVGVLFGFHKDATLADAKTLTVSVNKVIYEDKKDEIQDECKRLLGKTNIKYVVEGEMSGDECQLILVFDKDVDLGEVKDTIQGVFDEKKEKEDAWKGSFIDVSASTEVTASILAKHYVLRAAIAAGVIAVLAFAYMAIRYQKISVGLLAGLFVALGMGLTTALVILTRVFVTTSVAGVIALAGLLTAAMVAFNFGKLHAAKKESDASLDELVVSSLAVKEILLLAGSIAVAMVVVGAVGRTAAAWFAVSALLAIVASTFVALIFAPAAYLSVATWLGAKPAKNAYVGAKKTSKKEKKASAPKAEEAPAATPVEEAPVESLEEAPVEEAPVENVEETPAEESEEAAE